MTPLACVASSSASALATSAVVSLDFSRIAYSSSTGTRARVYADMAAVCDAASALLAAIYSAVDFDVTAAADAAAAARADSASAASILACTIA